MGLRVESVFWLNVERVCSFLPAFCLCLGDRFTVFVSGQRGRLRGGVCGSVCLWFACGSLTLHSSTNCTQTQQS